jgi:hypothetical protein
MSNKIFISQTHVTWGITIHPSQELHSNLTEVPGNRISLKISPLTFFRIIKGKEIKAVFHSHKIYTTANNEILSLLSKYPKFPMQKKEQMCPNREFTKP